MDWLNYHHLLYFFTVAREGGVTKAAQVLQLAQPTLSAQIRKLEAALDERLFVREGRRLVLTEVGRIVYRYAEEIFSLGDEMVDAVRGRPIDRPTTLTVGVADVVPKIVCQRVLQTALNLEKPVHLVVHEGKNHDLMAALALKEYDMVLTDAPLNPEVRVKAFNHPLGECGVAFFARPPLARKLRRSFPRSLDDQPMLLPTTNSALRRTLDSWFERLQIRPRVVAEIEDTALIKAFGQHGNGVFAAPNIAAEEIRRAHGVGLVGETDDVRERFYAITVERRITHPAIAAITAAARTQTLAFDHG